jgi:hypothetical protein
MLVRPPRSERQQPAAFVAASTLAGDSGTSRSFALPASGTADGDLAMIFIDSQVAAVVSSGGDGGWTRATWAGKSGGTAGLLWKRLTSGDHAATLSIALGVNSGANIECAVYRHANALTPSVKASTAGNSDPESVAGFVPDARSVGVVSHHAVDSATASAIPSGFTSRANVLDVPGDTRSQIADRLDTYVAGTATDWNKNAGDPSGSVVVELVAA